MRRPHYQTGVIDSAGQLRLKNETGVEKWTHWPTNTADFEVFGNRELLTGKLREGWREAELRKDKYNWKRRNTRHA